MWDYFKIEALLIVYEINGHKLSKFEGYFGKNCLGRIEHQFIFLWMGTGSQCTKLF